MKTLFDFNEKQDKHIFAGLFNTAVDNFEVSLKELNKRMNHKEFKGNGKEEKIIDFAFNNARPQIEFDNNFNFLSESLIFIKRIPSFIKKIDTKKDKPLIVRNFLSEFLIDLYKTLDDYRNYYTHFQHDEIIVENKLIVDFLEYVLFNSTNRVKDDKVKIDTVKKKLEVKYKNDIDFIVTKQNVRNKEHGKKLIKVNDKTNFTLNKMFHYFIDNSTKNPKLTDNVACGNVNAFTSSGFIQLLTLFLNRKEVNLLFDNVKYTKYTTDTELQKIISRWVYTYESYKDIKYLFKSEYDNNALLLQMVSELTKCPKNLYPYLSDSDKNEFVEDINIYLKENTSILDDDALVTHEIIRKRYEDKFAYFAIRFLDEFANFPTLRFQVNMGKFNHDTREKLYISTKKKTERKILEKIVVFEKLTTATKSKNAYFKKEERQEINDWVEHPRPQFQFFGNSIGIWLSIGDLGNYSVKETKRNNDKLTKYDILDRLKLKDKFKKPVAYLSNYELPAILHSFLIEGKKGSDIENKIKGMIIKQRSFVDKLNINKSYSDNELKQLPKKIRTILKRTGFINRSKIKAQLVKELKVNPLKNIRKQYKKELKNEKELSLSEKGKIATWLSKDIKRFTKKSTKKDWKGYQFSEFQALLSYFDIDKSNLSNFLSKDLQFNKETDFAFKNGIDFGKINLYEFYLNYMKERENHINHLLKNFDNTNDKELLLPFKANKFVIKTLEVYKKDKLDEPVMLARGIFDDNPTGYNKNKGEKPVFANWFKLSMNEKEAQEFYNFNKQYPLTQRMINNKMKVTSLVTINNSKGLKEQYKNIDTIRDPFILTSFNKEHILSNKKENESLKLAQYQFKQKEVYKNESFLRRTMRNDFYLLEMIKRRIIDTTEINKTSLDKITLKDFYLTKKEKQEIKKESVKQSTKQIGDTSKVIFNDTYILNRRIKLPLLDGKIICDVPLKESSKYKKLAQDVRVKQLTKFYTDTEWNIEEIENEINDYNLIRSKIFFKQIHQLEQKIYNKAINENKLNAINNISSGKSIPNFKKYLIYYFLPDAKDKVDFNFLLENKAMFIDAKEKFKKLYLLIEIRNKFSHNQFISVHSFSYLLKTYPMKKEERVATYLNNIFNIIINEID